jgi:hypothetical protein
MTQREQQTETGLPNWLKQIGESFKLAAPIAAGVYAYLERESLHLTLTPRLAYPGLVFGLFAATALIYLRAHRRLANPNKKLLPWEPLAWVVVAFVLFIFLGGLLDKFNASSDSVLVNHLVDAAIMSLIGAIVASLICSVVLQFPYFWHAWRLLRRSRGKDKGKNGGAEQESHAATGGQAS